MPIPLAAFRGSSSRLRRTATNPACCAGLRTKHIPMRLLMRPSAVCGDGVSTCYGRAANPHSSRDSHRRLLGLKGRLPLRRAAAAAPHRAAERIGRQSHPYSTDVATPRRQAHRRRLDASARLRLLALWQLTCSQHSVRASCRWGPPRECHGKTPTRQLRGAATRPPRTRGTLLACVKLVRLCL